MDFPAVPVWLQKRGVGTAKTARKRPVTGLVPPTKTWEGFTVQKAATSPPSLQGHSQPNGKRGQLSPLVPSLPPPRDSWEPTPPLLPTWSDFVTNHSFKVHLQSIAHRFAENFGIFHDLLDGGNMKYHFPHAAEGSSLQQVLLHHSHMASAFSSALSSPLLQQATASHYLFPQKRVTFWPWQEEGGAGHPEKAAGHFSTGGEPPPWRRALTAPSGWRPPAHTGPGHGSQPALGQAQPGRRQEGWGEQGRPEGLRGGKEALGLARGRQPWGNLGGCARVRGGRGREGQRFGCSLV